jgi:hypothetical protein
MHSARKIPASRFINTADLVQISIVFVPMLLSGSTHRIIVCLVDVDVDQSLQGEVGSPRLVRMLRKGAKQFRIGDLMCDMSGALDNGLAVSRLAGLDHQKVSEFYTVVLHCIIQQPGKPHFASQGVQVHRGEGAAP